MRFHNFLLLISLASTPLFAATAYHNQVGFPTKGVKQLAVVGAEGKDIVFKDSTKQIVLTVKAPAAAYWKPANENASLVDFSEIQKPGTYIAYLGDSAISHPIIISDKVLEDVTVASLRWFYYQRASMELTEEFAGIYARPMGHPDTAARYHSLLGKELMATFASPKGWYDAGDYGKYIVNSGISTYTLLQLYQHNKEYFKSLSLNIPESKNDVPDILDEIRWNLEWMLTMQDPEDGGVFHKLTTKQFSGTVMPDRDTKPRFAIGKSNTATWNFVAVLALASEIYKPYDSEFSKKMADAAGKAFWWAKEHPYDFFEQPSDVGTGTYEDGNAVDEQIWASAELYRITRNDSVLDVMRQFPLGKSRWKLQGWQTTSALAAFTIATNPDVFEQVDVDSAKALILHLADDYIKSLENNGYGVAMTEGDFYWGSNSVGANKGIVLLHAYILTKKEEYLNAATGILDYLLGRNPLNLSYLTGYGVNQVFNPHHRPSQADGIDAPIPGMLVGGPNKSANDCAKKYIDNEAVARSYYDNACSYATNEVAINWNAPFAYLAGSIHAIISSGKTYDIHSSVEKFEINGIPSGKPNFSKNLDSGVRMIFREGSVQLEKTTKTGMKIYYNLKGKKLN